MEARSVAGSDFAVVLTTAGEGDKARTLARSLVEARLAACVSVLPISCSVYRWKGEVVEEPESLLLIKTKGERIPELRLWIAGHHPYELPEFLVFEVREGSPEYLDWLAESTRGPGSEA